MTTHKNKIIFEGGSLTNRKVDNNILTLWVDNGYRRVEIDVGRMPTDLVLQKVKEMKEQIGLENIKQTEAKCASCNNPVILIDHIATCFKCRIQLQQSVSRESNN